jgi:hypothetical protein
MEVDLENGVKVANLRPCTLQESLVKDVFEQARTGRCLSKTEEVSKASVLGPLCLVNVEQGALRASLADDRDRESSQQVERRNAGPVSIGSIRRILLEGLARGDLGGAVAEKVIVPAPSGGMEEVVVRNQEDAGQVLVVVGHHYVLGGPLAEIEKRVDILDGAESFLPQLKLNGNIKLLERVSR